jgi:Family of unknown function (DUF6527)
MSFKSCPMVYHATKGESFFEYPVGHFYWSVDETDGERLLWMKLPRQDDDPQGSACIIPVRPTADTPAWGWDGNIEKPTLTPSVFHDPQNPESPHHWHGFIQNGEMKGC